jgi:hypothetical protein
MTRFMNRAAVVAGVLAQLEELLEVEVPGLEVGADRALALATLVDGHGGVVHHLQERHHALALAVGALDVAAEGAHARPVVAQAASELAEQGVFLQGLVDAVEVVGHRGEVAARELAAARAAVEQRRRRAHEVEAGEHAVELDGARLAVDLAQCQAHGHTHEEGLRHLDAVLVDVQEVAVVQRLQAEVVELQVAAGVERGAQAGQIELQQLVVEQLGLDALLDELRKVVGVAHGHLRLRDLFAEDLAADGVQQQAGRGARVARLLLDQRAGGQDGGLVDLVDRHAVIEVAARLGQDRLGLHLGAQAGTGALDQRAQRVHVQRHALAVLDDVQVGRLHDGRRTLARTLLRSTLAVQHVGARHLVMAAAHQAEFDLVLHVLDVEGAAARAAAQQGAHDAAGELLDRLAHAGRSRALRAVHRQKGLHQRDRDLVGLEADDGAVAPDDLVRGVGGRGRTHHGGGHGRSRGLTLRRLGGDIDRLHSIPSVSLVWATASVRRGVRMELRALPCGSAAVVWGLEPGCAGWVASGCRDPVAVVWRFVWRIHAPPQASTISGVPTPFKPLAIVFSEGDPELSSHARMQARDNGFVASGVAPAGPRTGLRAIAPRRCSTPRWSTSPTGAQRRMAARETLSLLMIVTHARSCRPWCSTHTRHGKPAAVQTADQAQPVETGAGIGLAPRRHVFVPHDLAQRMTPRQTAQQAGQRAVLGRLEVQAFEAFELDAHRPVVAVRAPAPR